MTKEEFWDYQEAMFDAFSKKVIKYQKARLINKYSKRKEVNLPDLSARDELLVAAWDDCCFEKETFSYYVLGYPVVVRNSSLGQALGSLPPKYRDVILSSYFLDLRDEQIGQMLKLNPHTVRYRRRAAIERMRKLLEEIEDEM